MLLIVRRPIVLTEDTVAKFYGEEKGLKITTG